MDRFLKDQENKIEEPLSCSAMESLNTHLGAWTNREEVWVIEERRLLFSTMSTESTNKWIEVLEALVTKNDQYFVDTDTSIANP